MNETEQRHAQIEKRSIGDHLGYGENYYLEWKTLKLKQIINH